MITTDDLIEPEGELDLALLFPDLTSAQAEDKLQAWIDKAAAEINTVGVTDQDAIDRGLKAYAYFRAYKSIYQRLSAQPISKNLQDAGISVSMTQGQIDSFKQAMLNWELIWQRVIETTVTTAILPGASVAVKTEIGF